MSDLRRNARSRHWCLGSRRRAACTGPQRADARGPVTALFGVRREAHHVGGTEPPQLGPCCRDDPEGFNLRQFVPNRSRAGQTGVSRVPGSRRLSPPSASGPRRTTRHKCNARPGQIEAACFARARARSPELTALFVVRGGRRGGACLLRRCERPQPGHCRRGVSRHPLLASQFLCATTSAASTTVD